MKGNKKILSSIKDKPYFQKDNFFYIRTIA